MNCKIHNFSTMRKIDSPFINKMASLFGICPTIYVVDDHKGNKFRGLQIDNFVLIFNRKEETSKSISWIFCHELAHFLMNNNKDSEKESEITYRYIKPFLRKKHNKEYLKHIITESLCDYLATTLCGRSYAEMKKENKNGKSKRNRSRSKALQQR